MFSRVLLASVIVLLLASSAPADPAVYTQAAVFWTTDAEREALLDAFPALDIMQVKPGHSFIIVTNPEELSELQAMGFRTEVVIENMERFYASRAKGNR